MMPDKGGREVIKSACTLALGDEPFAGRVEYCALDFMAEPFKPGIALHHSINGQVGR